MMFMNKYQKLRKYNVHGKWVDAQALYVYCLKEYRGMNPEELPEDAIEEYLADYFFSIDDVEKIKQYHDTDDELELDERYTFVHFYNGGTAIISVPYEDFKKLLLGRKPDIGHLNN